MLEGISSQSGQLDGQAFVFRVHAVDQRRRHDGHLCGGAQPLPRLQDRQVNHAVRGSVGESGERVLLVIGVDLVALELALGVVAEETGAAGVNEDGVLVVLGPSLDALDDGLDRRQVVRGRRVDHNVAGDGVLDDGLPVVERPGHGLGTALFQFLCVRCSTGQGRDRVAIGQEEIEDFSANESGSYEEHILPRSGHLGEFCWC